MSSTFIESYKGDQLDPLFDGATYDFPYAEIDESIATQDTNIFDRHAADIQNAIEIKAKDYTGEALEILFEHLLEGNYKHRGFLNQIGRRLVGCAWALDPAIFDGQSLSALARSEGILCHKSSLSDHAVKFSDLFELSNRAMASKETRLKNRKAALRRLARQREDRRNEAEQPYLSAQGAGAMIEGNDKGRSVKSCQPPQKKS